MRYTTVLDAIGHTPLVEIARMSPHPGVRLFAKLEGQNLGGSASVKDRIAKYMIEKAQKSGELTLDKIILEATSGNTGISLAMIGRRKGYKVTVARLLHAETDDERDHHAQIEEFKNRKRGQA